MKYIFFLCISLVIGACVVAVPETRSTTKKIPVSEQVVETDMIQFLETRVKQLENLLKDKEEEIIALQQIYQFDKKTQESQTQEKIIIQSLSKDLEEEFRLNNQDLPFKIGKNKQDEDLKLTNTSLDSSTKNDFLEKKIKLIPVQKIKPSLFYKPPENPIRLKNIAVAKQKYRSNYRLFSSKKYDQAIQEFSKFIAFYPNANESDNAIFWIAMSYFKKNKEDKAQQYLAFLLQNYDFLEGNKGGKTADALFVLGRIQEKRNSNYSKEYYRLVIRYYPNSVTAQKAKNLLKHL